MSTSWPRAVVMVAALLAGPLAAGCAKGLTGPADQPSSYRSSAPTQTVTMPPSASRSSPPTPTPTPTPTPVRMVTWHGPVEELFVHPLVIRPQLAFTSDSLGIGFQHYFVTAYEFRRILDQLWHNGWTLVDIHRAADGTVRVPVGRRPLVLSEDDVNYYHYFRGRGLTTGLAVAGDRVLAQLPDGRLTDKDVVPMVEEEVAEHPEFSADGARGVLAETGYEGLFGEHHPYTVAARERLLALARWLTSHGWTIASHTWGHIDLSHSSLATIAADTARWKALAEPLLGSTDVLIYPFGARPDATAVRQLVRDGYRIQLDIDVVARTWHRDGAVIMSRRHIDGYAFEVPAQQAQFYDVAAVRDPARPG